MKYLNLLSSNIKLLRLKHDLTQEEFAEKIGLTTNGVSNIERKRYQPTVNRTGFNPSKIKLKYVSG